MCGVGKRHTEASKGQEGKRTRLVDGPVRGSRRCVVDDSTSLGQGKRLSCLGWWKGRIDRARILVLAWAWCGPLRSDIGCGKAVDAKMNFFAVDCPPLAPAVDSSFVARPFED